MTVTLRRATMDDADYLLALKNDPEALRRSWVPIPVPRESHMAWLANAVESGNPAVYVAWDGDVAVGTIRVQAGIEGDEVSLTVEAQHRGRGYGTAMLQAAAKIHRVRLHGWIQPDNAASLRAFEKAGFALRVKAVME